MDIQSREDYYDEPLLEYVVDFANKVFTSYNEDGFYLSNMPDLFGDRYVKGIIKPIGFDKYLDDKLEIQYTLDAFGLDSNKFWYLCLFLKDYVKEQTTNAIKINPTHREELSNLLYELDKMNIKIKYDRILSAEKGGKLSFKVEGGKKVVITDKTTLIYINAAITTFMEKYNNILDESTLDINATTSLPLIYQIYLFNKYLSMFLKPLVAKKGTRASKDKSFLISKMIYVLSISDDVKFITEYKDNGDKLNHLKNLLSRYKNIKIRTLNSTYW
jgi:hypothetical protein